MSNGCSADGWTRTRFEMAPCFAPSKHLVKTYSPRGSESSGRAANSVSVNDSRNATNWRISVSVLTGRLPHLATFEAFSAFTRVSACMFAGSPEVTRYIRGFDGFVTSSTAPTASGWSDPSPGGTCTHWKSPPLHGAQFSDTTAGSPRGTRHLHGGRGEDQVFAKADVYAHGMVAFRAHPRSVESRETRRVRRAHGCHGRGHVSRLVTVSRVCIGHAAFLFWPSLRACLDNDWEPFACAAEWDLRDVFHVDRQVWSELENPFL